MSDSSYRPLTDEEKITNSGVVLPSGEANFAALVEQKPGAQDGINLDYDATTSGVVPMGQPKTGPIPELDPVLAPIFDDTPFSNSVEAEQQRNRVDLTDFKPYIHYYPSPSTILTSLYSSTVTNQAVLIDYSLVFDLSNYYNWYNYFNFSFGYGSVYNPDGTPYFDNPYLIPPNDYIL